MPVVDGVGECGSADLPRLNIDGVTDCPAKTLSSSLPLPLLLPPLHSWRVQHLLQAESFEEEASREEVQADFLLRLLVRVDVVSRVNPGSGEGSWDGKSFYVNICKSSNLSLLHS